MASSLGFSVQLFASVFVLANTLEYHVYEEQFASAPFALVSHFARPSQIHVAFADEVTMKSYRAIRTSNTAAMETRLGMTVSWVTDIKTATSSVRYGLSKDELSTLEQAQKRCEQYVFCSYKSPWIHHVTIPGDKLQPDTTYFCTRRLL